MDMLTEHFSLDEFINSQTATRYGIDNNPDEWQLFNLERTAKLLERVRLLLNKPVYISSGFRSEELNMRIGGSVASQHCKGEAADILAPGFGTPKDVAEAIERSDIDYDQLIYEGNWVHISQKRVGNRNQTLTAVFGRDGVVYREGIV